MKSVNVLTVCLGNICRSPAAQGILAACAKQRKIPLELDSAGTAAYHVGNPPDSRSIAALAEVGVDISGQRARQVTAEDFHKFDWILAMDRENLADLKKRKPDDSRATLVMFGEFAEGVSLGAVQDPYYGKEDGFVDMRQHLQTLSEHFLDHLLSR